MAHNEGDWVALTETGIAEAGACGSITYDYGNNHYDVLITRGAPPDCEDRSDTPTTAIHVPGDKLTACECPDA